MIFRYNFLKTTRFLKCNNEIINLVTKSITKLIRK